MAINKNFVIKHGVEVNTNLIVGDADTQKVGIGTTVPQYSLHVGGLRGGIGASDAYVSGVTTVRDLHVTGITTFDTGRVLIGAGASTGTRSQLLHVGSATTEGGVYISGDVGLGVTLPGAKLNVVPGSSAIAGLFSGTTEKDMVRITQLGGGNALRIDDIASDASPFVVTGIGSVGIGTTNPEYALVVDSLVSTGTTALFVHGDAQITGDLIVDDFSLDELTVDQVNVTGILTSAQTKLNGITTAANINITGIATVGTALSLADNVKAQFGTGGDLIIYHSGSSSNIKDTSGDLSLVSDTIYLELSGGSNIVKADEYGIIVAGVTTTQRLYVSGISTFKGNIDADGDLDVDGTANLDVIDVDGTANFADDVTLVAAGSSTILFDASAHSLIFQDNIRAKFGTGSDLSIFHDGTDSRIINNTGLTYLQGDVIRFRNQGDSSTIFNSSTTGVDLYAGGSVIINANVAGAVVTGITTTNLLNVTGVGTITGGLIVGAGATFTGNVLPETDGTRDLGSSTKEWNDLYIDGEAHIDTLDVDGAAFVTTKLSVGTGVTAFANGNLAVAGIATIGSDLVVKGNLDVTGDITYDEITGRNLNITGFTTLAGAVNIDGTVDFANDVVFNGTNDITWDASESAVVFNSGAAIRVGTGSDAAIYHEGNSTIIRHQNTSGNLNIQSPGTIIRNLAGDETIASFIDDSDGVSLYNNNLKRFETLGVGASVLGNFTVSGVNTTGDGNFNVSGISTFTSIGSNLIPDADGTRNIGAATSEWGDLFIDGTANIDTLDVDGTSNFADDVTLVAAGSSTIAFDASAHTLTFQDNIRAKFGTGSDLAVYHGGQHSFIDHTQGSGNFFIKSAANIALQANGSTTGINVNAAGDVNLTHAGNIKITTDKHGTITTGVSTATTFSVGDGSHSTDRISIGDDNDLALYHNASNSFIVDRGTGPLYIRGNAAVRIESYTNDSAGEPMVIANSDSSVDIYYDNVKKFATSGVGATVYGTGALNVPVGTTAERPTTGNSPQDGDIRYNSTLKSYEGYGNSAWGGLGGGTEIDTSVSSTSATSITTFVHAEHRSAYFRVQIVQGSAYQVGRYLLIHDGTTVTVVEESAIATGSMLGTITAAIVSTNVVIYVNMGSSSSATVTTIIDKITV